MRGHLEARGKDVWRAKVYLGRDADNSKRYLTRTIHGSKRRAEDILAQIIVEAGVGSHDVTDGTVGDLAARWLAITRPSLSPTTLWGYERLLDKVIVPRLGPVKLRALRPQAIDSFYADLLGHGGKDGKPLSAQSVQHVHALLRHILNQGVRWGWLTSNPALKASPPKVRKKEIVTPDPDEVMLLIAEAERTDPDLAVFLRLAAVTGARRGELCALRWTDIDLVAGSVTIARAIVGQRNDELIEKDTKTHAGRRIALDPETVDVLARHRDRCEARAAKAETTLPDNAFLFSPTVDGSRAWRPGGVSLAFIRIRKRAGVRKVPLHSLRHFAATRMLAAGVPVRTVAGRLGHADAATTLNVYGHWIEASDQTAAAVLGDLLGNGDKAPTSSPSPPARRKARGAGTRPRSGAKRAPQ